MMMMIIAKPAFPVFAVARTVVSSAVRCLSTSQCIFEKVKSTPPASSPVKKTVLISQSHDIFSNLALEDWLYKKADFSSRRALLLWRNNPAVVIGRHQNPWTEANVEFCSEHRIPIARRNSGGGTVYHDMGNLNICFFMPRSEYNRKNNLEIIRAAVWDTYGLDLTINDRDDLLWNGAKVSGTAAKLGRNVAYHHCTLLIHSDRAFLHRALNTDAEKAGYKSNATESIKSKTACLREAEPLARVTDILNAIGRVFLETPVVDKKGNNLEIENGGYQMVNPSDYWYPGLCDIKRDLASWDWIYGRTPDFSVTRRYSLPAPSMITPLPSSPRPEISVTLRVSKGIVVDVESSETQRSANALSSGSNSSLLRNIDVSRISSLKGQRYAEHLLDVTVGQAFDGPLKPSSEGSDGRIRSGNDNRVRGYKPMGEIEKDYVTSILTCA